MEPGSRGPPGTRRRCRIRALPSFRTPTSSGRLQRLNYPSSTGIVADFTWDVAGNLEEIHYKRGGLSVHRMKYLYDPSGNRSHFVDTPMDLTQARTWEYRYDGLNRLKTVYQDGELVSFYDFDESDNRLRMDNLQDGIMHRFDYSYDTADQISGIKRDDIALFEFRHDRDGNMTLKKDLVTTRYDSYLWNESGRLTTITVHEPGQPEKVTRNDYDAGDIRKRRVGSDGSKVDYYYSGLLALTEIKSVGAEEPTLFLLGHQVLGFTRNGDSYWYITDALGMVRGIVDSSGDIVDTYTYDEYGNPSKSTTLSGSDHVLTGGLGARFEFGSGLSLNGLRWYLPDAGRFTSVDPAEGAAQNPLRHHPYAYADNNPVMNIDPTGEIAIAVAAIAAIEIGLSGLDMYATIQIWQDPSATMLARVSVTGATTIGVFAPGGGYGAAASGGNCLLRFTGKLPGLKGKVGIALAKVELWKRNIRVVGEELTFIIRIVTAAGKIGVRRRIDLIGQTALQRLRSNKVGQRIVDFFEVKHGPNAGLSPNQKQTQGVLPGPAEARGPGATAKGFLTGKRYILRARKLCAFRPELRGEVLRFLPGDLPLRYKLKEGPSQANF